MPSQLLTAYYEAYNAGDEASLTALLDREVTLTSAQGTISGRTAYLDIYRHMTSLFVDFMTPLAMQQSEDRVVVQIENSLTARADIADFMGTSLQAGEKLTLRLKGEYVVKNQQIMHIDIAII